MSAWQNLKIGLKITIGFSAVLIVLVALGLFSMQNLGVINDQSTELSDNWLPSVESVSGLNTLAGDFRSAQGEYLVGEDDVDQQEAAASMKAAEAAIEAARKQYEAQITEDSERAIYQQFGEIWG